MTNTQSRLQLALHIDALLASDGQALAHRDLPAFLAGMKQELRS